MRVSADGDAIDSSPLTITGTHLGVHVASSGAESLITLDGLDQVSTIVAHDEGKKALTDQWLIKRGACSNEEERPDSKRVVVCPLSYVRCRCR